MTRIKTNAIQTNLLSKETKIREYISFYRLLKKTDDVDTINVTSRPFQQTSEPQEFNIGVASSAVLIGMDFVLVPITLAVDMVYDREVSFFTKL